MSKNIKGNKNAKNKNSADMRKLINQYASAYGLRDLKEGEGALIMCDNDLIPLVAAWAKMNDLDLDFLAGPNKD